MPGIANRAPAAPAIRTLLAGAIDYAGLFPPAAVTMTDAVRGYASYRAAPSSWALGRFVVPAARLAELQQCVAGAVPRASSPWPLAVLAGEAGADDWPAVRRLGGEWIAGEAFELRARTPDDVRAVARQVPADIDVFHEVPIDRDPAPFIAAIARVGGKAKVRTGGVTAEAFPRAADLARFIVTCARAAVPFKATAGLHHAISATYRLTYAENSVRGEMFGFLNVLLAAAFARAGLGVRGVSQLLAERDISAFRFELDGVAWRDRRVSGDGLAATRSLLALSFGSCSFTEPIEELGAYGLL